LDLKIIFFTFFVSGAPNSPHFLLRHGGVGKPEEKKLSPFDKFRNMDSQSNAQTPSIAPG
jgi:hypothetical protein